MAKKTKGTQAILHVNDNKKTVDSILHKFSGTTIKEIQKELKTMVKSLQKENNTWWYQGTFTLNEVTYQIEDLKITPDIEELGFLDNMKDITIIHQLIPKISEEDAEELLCIRSTNQMSRPEDYSEMKESARMAKWFWKKLDKFPLLLELGFDHGDAYDYTQD